MQPKQLKWTLYRCLDLHLESYIYLDLHSCTSWINTNDHIEHDLTAENTQRCQLTNSNKWTNYNVKGLQNSTVTKIATKLSKAHENKRVHSQKSSSEMFPKFRSFFCNISWFFDECLAEHKFLEKSLDAPVGLWICEVHHIIQIYKKAKNGYKRVHEDVAYVILSTTLDAENTRVSVADHLLIQLDPRAWRNGDRVHFLQGLFQRRN